MKGVEVGLGQVIMNRLRQVKRARHAVFVAVHRAGVDLGFPVLFACGSD
jgi:hypothetical protein